LLSGNAALHQIDDFVDAWHESDGSVALHDYLGMTMEEYALWVSEPESLARIARARRDHLPLFAAVR
jgi:hypothetical protein